LLLLTAWMGVQKLPPKSAGELSSACHALDALVKFALFTVRPSQRLYREPLFKPVSPQSRPLP